MKIVINTCSCRFGLSETGMQRYADIKGLELFVERKSSHVTNYWLAPPDQRPRELSPGEWQNMSLEAHTAYSDAYSVVSLSPYDLNRDDPVLVQVVEELGNTASNPYCSLKVVEIPDDVEWEINEYNGIEHVAEKHRTWS